MGRVITVVERENDLEDKLIVTTNEQSYTIDEMKKNVDFQE